MEIQVERENADEVAEKASICGGQEEKEMEDSCCDGCVKSCQDNEIQQDETKSEGKVNEGACPRCPQSCEENVKLGPSTIESEKEDCSCCEESCSNEGKVGVLESESCACCEEGVEQCDDVNEKENAEDRSCCKGTSSCDKTIALEESSCGKCCDGEGESEVACCCGGCATEESGPAESDCCQEDCCGTLDKGDKGSMKDCTSSIEMSQVSAKAVSESDKCCACCESTPKIESEFNCEESCCEESCCEEMKNSSQKNSAKVRLFEEVDHGRFCGKDETANPVCEDDCYERNRKTKWSATPANSPRKKCCTKVSISFMCVRLFLCRRKRIRSLSFAVDCWLLCTVNKLAVS